MEPHEQAVAAEVFAKAGHSGALPALRRKAASFAGDEGWRQSLWALARLHDLESVELFRETVRESSDPTAVAVAAVTLGRWQDRFSYSTMLLALLRPRVDGAAPAALLSGLTQLGYRPFLRSLLSLVMEGSTSYSSRVAAAAALADKGSRKNGGAEPIREVLEGALRGDWLGSEPPAATRTLALWGLARLSRTDCRNAAAAAAAQFDAAPEDRRRELARTIVAAGLSCWESAGPSPAAWERISQAAALPGEVRALLEREAARVPPVALDPACPAGEIAGWPEAAAEGGGFEARLLTNCAARFGRDGDDFGLKSIPRAHVRRIELRALARASRGWTQSEGYDSYEFTPGQPEWWPSWIDLTIDDGPQPTLWRLDRILDSLDRWGVKATFFLIGANMARLRAAEPVRGPAQLLRLLGSGHRVGYHSVVHDTRWRWHLQFWTPGQIRDDVDLFEEVFALTTGAAWDRRLARLPGGMGRHLGHVRHGLDLAGLHAHVHWQVDSRDWAPDTSRAGLEALAANLVRARKPVVILLHENAVLGRQIDVFIKAVHKAMQESASGNTRRAAGPARRCDVSGRSLTFHAHRGAR